MEKDECWDLVLWLFSLGTALLLAALGLFLVGHVLDNEDIPAWLSPPFVGVLGVLAWIAALVRLIWCSIHHRE